jgi:hypothetical protein
MAETIKKPFGRPPSGKGLLVGVRLQPDMVAMVDAWIAAQPKPVSRPEAIRQMLALVKDQIVAATSDR